MRTIPCAPKVLRFKRNELGRDFVVGDIHGCFDLVLDAMREARFNPGADRLFSVGDLIDRGPGSHRCVKFLAQPYIHAVRGNHEDTLLDLYEDGDPLPQALVFAAHQFGLRWWLTTPEEERQKILVALRALPFVIEIETNRGTVGLLHADVPSQMDWTTFISKIQAGDPKTTETCLWGRNRIKHDSTDPVEGIGRIFVGHTPRFSGLTRHGNVYAVDTGAVFGTENEENSGHLTMACITMKTGLLLAPRKSLALVELRDDFAGSVEDPASTPAALVPPFSSF